MADAVGGLVEPRNDAPSQRDPPVHHRELGVSVLDPNLVVVGGGEEHPDG